MCCQWSSSVCRWGSSRLPDLWVAVVDTRLRSNEVRRVLKSVACICIVKTNSPCLSSHDEDVNTFQFQQAPIFTATLLFQPQLITTMYIQLQMIIYKSSVCCFTHMHTDIISYMTYSWDARNLQMRHNNKRQYFIEPFLISVRCKREHFWRSFLSSLLILSRLTTSCRRFFVWQWQQVCDQISNLRLYYVDSGTQHHNKMIF